MKRGKRQKRSITQRVGNRGRERSLAREDAFVAYVMDRFLYRLGRSRHAGEFILKGGVLVADLMEQPHRFTRDIDVLRRHGPPDPVRIRGMFRQIVLVEHEDDVQIKPENIRAIPAEHDEDGYDGVKVFIRCLVGSHEVELRLDIGFGDAVVPGSLRRSLVPFLEGDEPAQVMTYSTPALIAEKVQTIVSKFPVIRHRLKDILDVVALSKRLTLDGIEMVSALRATFKRRASKIETTVLDEMESELQGRAWETTWAVMIREKSVTDGVELREAVVSFNRFVRPLLLGVEGSAEAPERWLPGGPWDGSDDRS